MGGEASEGMILAGVVDNKGPNEVCEVLDFEDPSAVEVGTRITIDGVLDPVGAEADNTSVKNISKQWAKVQPLFNVTERFAYLSDKFKWGVKSPKGMIGVCVKSIKKGAIH